MLSLRCMKFNKKKLLDYDNPYLMAYLHRTYFGSDFLAQQNLTMESLALCMMRSKKSAAFFINCASHQTIWLTLTFDT